MREEEGFSFLLGIVVTGIAVFLFFQAGESRCQQQNNVADCEWSRSPFTPTTRQEARDAE